VRGIISTIAICGNHVAECEETLLTTGQRAGAPGWMRSFIAEASAWRRRCVLPGLFSAAFAPEPGQDDGFDGGFQQSLAERQSIIQPGAFLEFGEVQGCLAGDHLGGFAAFGSHGLDLAGDPGSAANWQEGISFTSSHVSNITFWLGSVIRRMSELQIGVCPTNTLFDLRRLTPGLICLSDQQAVRGLNRLGAGPGWL
jgi:hypothetical protein